MRILHVINSLAAGGAERSVADILPRLARQGETCLVLALDARHEVHAEALRDSGVEVRFSREGGASPYSPIRALDIARTIREFRPDVVHAHLAPTQHWTLAALGGRRRDSGPVFALTEHAVENRRMSMPLLRGIEGALYRACDGIVAVSEGVAASLRTWLGLPGDAITLIPNGINLDRFPASAADPGLASWAEGRRLVVMVGRFVPAKDHATALRALSFLPADVALALVGDGPQRPAMEKLAGELGLDGRVRFLGTRTDIPEILAAARLYLQTSSSEGFGIAVAEAMASGVPVCSSPVGGIPEVLGGCGRTFPAGDAAGCAREVAAALADEGWLAAQRSLGAKRARDLSIDETSRRHVAFYEGLLARRDGSRAERA